MNYGKKSTKKRASQLTGKRTKAKKKFGVAFWKSLFVGILIIIAIAAIAAAIYVTRLIQQCPDISTVDISPEGYLTTVLDSDGNEIETLASSGANREYVTLDEIPVNLQHAIVAIEDERFYTHNGVDIRGMIRAGVTAVMTGFRETQGASTITQQLLKNNYFTTWTSEKTMLDRINRKIQEQYLAIQLEKVTSKEEILENYLNTINLGQNTLGVQAASERYFNKNVSDLTLSECAVIAAITQNPSRYNPISHPEENATRRQAVLDKMLDQGYIDQDEYDEAINDNVYDRIQAVNVEVQSSSSTSYFVDALTEQVIDDLVAEKGHTESEAYQLLYSGGLTIHSTQNTALQNICTEEINNQDNYSGNPKYSFSYRLTIQKADGSTENYSDQTMLSYYQASNRNYSINFSSQEEAAAAIEKYKSEIMEEGDTIPEGGETVTYTLQPQAAMTVIDQKTGAVVALVGGRGDKIGSRTLNRATGITRQPGSTFKILAAYAPALDAGGLTLASVQDDAPMTYADGTPLRNVDGNYRGFTPLREAITDSINVVTVKTLTQIGTGLGYEYVQNFGITTLASGDNTQSLALGGITNGVTNLELTAAFATIANSGYYNEPIFYTQVLDHDGNVLLDNTSNESRQVLKETTAWLLTSAMQDVVNSGTGGRAKFSGMSIAGKTGTTTSNRDTLFAGFTPYYTCVVWGGYDDNAQQNSTAYSRNIWRSAMSRIHEGLSDPGFPQPDGIVTAQVCRKSGKLAIPGVCDADPRGSMVYTEYFAEGTVPTETCDHHYGATICTESNAPAGPYCPSVTKGVYIIGGSQGTADTPYLLPFDPTQVTSCPIHTGASQSQNSDGAASSTGGSSGSSSEGSGSSGEGSDSSSGENGSSSESSSGSGGNSSSDSSSGGASGNTSGGSGTGTAQ